MLCLVLFVHFVQNIADEHIPYPFHLVGACILNALFDIVHSKMCFFLIQNYSIFGQVVNDQGKSTYVLALVQSQEECG